MSTKDEEVQISQHQEESQKENLEFTTIDKNADPGWWCTTMILKLGQEIFSVKLLVATSGVVNSSFFSGVINSLTYVKAAQGSKIRCHHV